MGILGRFLSENRNEIVHRWRERVLSRGLVPSSVPRLEINDSLPLFLDEVARAIDRGDAGASQPVLERSPMAEEHGAQRLRLGFDVEEMTREYGVLLDCVMVLLEERHVQVPPIELRRLVARIVTGTGDAVAEYARRRDIEFAKQTAHHLAFVAHELRNPLQSVRMAFEILVRAKSSAPALAAIKRGLDELSRQIDQSILQVQLASDVTPIADVVDLRTLVAELVEDCELDAAQRGLTLAIDVPEGLELRAEKRSIRSALSNLIRNAIKFSREGGAIVIRGRGEHGRVVIEVEDSCGGLPQDVIDKLGTPFVQLGHDRTGFGLGLAICRQVALSNGGSLTARSLAEGCVFVLELPGEPSRTP